jgi:hypothetical protein
VPRSSSDPPSRWRAAPHVGSRSCRRRSVRLSQALVFGFTSPRASSWSARSRRSCSNPLGEAQRGADVAHSGVVRLPRAGPGSTRRARRTALQLRRSLLARRRPL